MLFHLKLQLIKLQTFLKSLFWHISKGLPKSPQSIIDYRFMICINCESYSQENKECKQCGCAINQKSIFLNKLAWADQHCPLGKWKQYDKNNK